MAYSLLGVECWVTRINQYHRRMTSFNDVRKRHIRLMRLTCKTIGNVLMNVTPTTATTLRDGPTGWTTLEVLCHLARPTPKHLSTPRADQLT